jgi:AcrR family transcriptional regulator
MTEKAAYHHGNLRRALLDEALTVIAERGVEGLSLREVAMRVGVSHAAPHHHFAHKEDLIHALAHEGMALMDERMAAAAATAGNDPLQRLAAIGVAYVSFAVERPDYYAAFAAPEMAALSEDAPQPEESGGDTWGRLIAAVVECQKAGRLPAGDPMITGVSLWSLVHGLAELWRVGPLRQLPQASGGIEPLARLVVAAALGMPPEGPAGDDASWARQPRRQNEEATVTRYE